MTAGPRRAMMSHSNRLLQTAKYTSRAHPKPTPVHPVGEAINLVLEGIEERKRLRAARWELNAPRRIKKGIVDDGPYRNQDETVELSVNLNLDPRKPGQALRGAISLPHGSGKKVVCVVFTRNAEAAKAALEAGAAHAGGEELVEKIANGQIPLDFQRALATTDMQAVLGQKLARTLGPRGLMPNAKVGTLVPSVDKLVPVLKDQLAGQIQYRTDKVGVIHVGVGKGSFTPEQLVDNMRAVMNVIYEVKPESLGKKKTSKNAKYFLKAYLTSTQGPSLKLDLRTVDPTSSFFMGSIIE